MRGRERKGGRESVRQRDGEEKERGERYER